MIVYGKTELGCFNLCWDLGISWHRVSAARAFQYFGFSNTERKIPKIWFKETTFGYRVFAKWPNAVWKPKWYFVKTECCCRLLPLQLNPNILTGWYHGFSSELLFVSASVVVFAFVQMCICICHLEAKVVHRKDGMLLQPNMIWVMTFDDISSELLFGIYSLNEFVPLLGDSAVQGERHLSPFGTVLRRWSSSRRKRRRRRRSRRWSSSVADDVAGKYDLGPNPPPAPPLGNKTDPEPLSISPP